MFAANIGLLLLNAYHIYVTSASVVLYGAIISLVEARIAGTTFQPITSGRYCGPAVSIYPNDRRQLYQVCFRMYMRLSKLTIGSIMQIKKTTESQEDESNVRSPLSLQSYKKYSKSKEYFVFKQHLLL